MSLFVPDRIFIERDVLGLPLTRQVLQRCEQIPREVVPNAQELVKTYRQKHPGEYYNKAHLLLCRNRGRFLEPCPGTKKDYRCCGYAVLNTGTGCPLSCSYCVLQAYLNNPFITLYANVQDLLSELETQAADPGSFLARIGTGEYTDSLALDHLTDFSALLLPHIQKRRGAVLELKTKTVNIDRLLTLDCQEACIVSWSLNAADIVRSEERGAAPVDDRIRAARRIARHGYRVGFHFDPLIYYPGWEQGYREVVELLEQYIMPSSIAWISVGSLRYMPHLKQVSMRHFPGTGIFSQELVPGLDGKMRYLQEIRCEMYAALIARLRNWTPETRIYLCMEHPAVWQAALQWVPESNQELKKLLDTCVITDRGVAYGVS